MIVLSVASGTSADGLDVGLVDLDWSASDPDVVDAQVLHTGTTPWPEPVLGERLVAALVPAALDARQVAALDTAVGQAVADVAAGAVAECERLVGARPTLVVSPGQTLHHEVVDGECRGTLQIGQPAWAAERTGLPVVSDLRARDVAAGGHGAPLAAILDGLWLHAAPGERRVGLNLGGIANVAVVGAAGVEAAWDTGPAGCLLDLAATRATGGRLRYDVDGAMAAAGRVDDALLARLLAHPHYRAEPPVSTGREVFSAAYLDEVLAGSTPAWPDVLATLTELTATTVADAVAPWRPREVVGAGGGMDNPTLVAALERRLATVPLRRSDDLGLPAGGKEAVLWALLGFLAWHGVPTGSSGAHPRRVAGRFSPGAAGLQLPEPRVGTPRRLLLREPHRRLG